MTRFARDTNTDNEVHRCVGVTKGLLATGDFRGSDMRTDITYAMRCVEFFNKRDIHTLDLSRLFRVLRTLHCPEGQQILVTLPVTRSVANMHG